MRIEGKCRDAGKWLKKLIIPETLRAKAREGPK
jgi:hypothetical protein